MELMRGLVSRIEENKGAAIVIAGSGNDKKHIDIIADNLESYEIPYGTIINSAHKQIPQTMAIIDYLNNLEGLFCIVSVAGGTDALSGSLAQNLEAPVISCPPEYGKRVFNESSLNNPPGASNAFIYRPENVAKFIAQLYAPINQRFKALLKEKNQEKIESLINANSTKEVIREKWDYSEK